MKTSSVKKAVWRLILLPAISVTLLLAATLTFLYVAKLDTFVNERGARLAEKTAQLAHIALRERNPALLNELLQATLEEPLVRAIHLYDSGEDRHYHVGAQFPVSQSAGAVSEGELAIERDNEFARFAYAVVDSRGQNPLGWLEVELRLSPYWAAIYQTLLIVVLATIACLSLAGYLAVRLNANIAAPLNLIRETVQRLSGGELDARVDGQFAFEFERLAEAVNTMARALEQDQGDMQLHIDQSMEDLRETLETIEVQNIELDMARKDALAASQIKSEFLANTSHEIRTPLNGIIGFTNLAMKTSLDEKQRSYLQTIHDSALGLLTTINDILDFSKIESGKLVLDYVPLALRQVVEAAVDSHGFDALEKNLQVVTIVDNNIPPQLMGDPLRFTQVISNLLGNAIKFSQRGTISIDIKLRHFEENQVTIEVSVADEGIGLSAEQQSQLFSAFAQADASISRKYGGTGLGLAICKGLVERMRGEVGVESRPQQGARFWFTAQLGVDPHYAAPEQNCLAGQRILICSENELCVAQLQSLTESWQASSSRVDSIHDIFPTLRKARDSGREYQLVLLDISPDERKLPPPLLGNLAEQLEVELSCKVIVCCMPSHRRLFSQHGNNQSVCFVQKPITYDNLLEAIGQNLNIHLGAQPQEPAQATLAQRRVLLVDDNEANLQLTGEFLRDLGVTVVAAASGEQALERFAEGHFDVVFMDIQMPGMDGMETTGRIRQLESTGARRTPIIALTAHTMTEHKTDLLIAGMDDCIRKPVTEEQLAHMLSRWTGLANNLPERPIAPLGSANVPSHDPASPVNLPQCLSLANDKPDLARDMLRMLIESLPDERQAINAAFEQRDWEQLQERIHKLYGSCCYTGVPHLRSLAGLLDKSLQAGQTQGLSEAIASLDKAIDNILHWSEGVALARLFDETDQAT